MAIFKAYDIRGVYPTELDESIMMKIGRAFADFICGNTIAVGYDMRVSSKSLMDAFVKGVTMQGKDVLCFGLTSTPMAYFASCFLKADGTAMITASHNPKQYNGVKFTRERAIPISEKTGIREIEKRVLADNFKAVSEKGSVKEVDLLDDYKKNLSSRVSVGKPLMIVVDAANGMGSQDFLLVADTIKGKKELMYFDIDGTFPNHDANPMKEGAIDTLCKKVKETGADLGVAFDGDADRVFFVDECGEMVPSDYITALIAEEVLFKEKGPILFDLRSSWIVPEMITSYGGTPKMSKVGHSFIKAMMREEGALFAGELSGHFYFRFKDFDAWYDSGILACIKILNLLSSTDKKMSELVNPLKKYFTSGEINSKVDDKKGRMNALLEIYSSGDISLIDGIKVEFDDWWFNVRPSNTEPYLRLNLEAKTKELMEQKRDELLKLIRR